MQLGVSVGESDTRRTIVNGGCRVAVVPGVGCAATEVDGDRAIIDGIRIFMNKDKEIRRGAHLRLFGVEERIHGASEITVHPIVHRITAGIGPAGSGVDELVRGAFEDLGCLGVRREETVHESDGVGFVAPNITNAARSLSGDTPSGIGSTDGNGSEVTDDLSIAVAIIEHPSELQLFGVVNAENRDGSGFGFGECGEQH